jgi:hypothetical protein
MLGFSLSSRDLIFYFKLFFTVSLLNLKFKGCLECNAYEAFALPLIVATSTMLLTLSIVPYASSDETLLWNSSTVVKNALEVYLSLGVDKNLSIRVLSSLVENRLINFIHSF